MPVLELLMVLGVRVAVFVIRCLPIRWALGVGRWTGRVAYLFHHRRRVAYANLKAAFGSKFDSSERKRIVLRNFEHLGQNIVEMFRFPLVNDDFMKRYMSFTHLDRYQEAVAGKNGAIFLAAHFGNWELSQIVSVFLGATLNVLARQQRLKRLNDYLNELRSSHGSVTVHKGEGVRKFIKVLRANGVVAALSDLSGGKQGVMVDFFGRKTTAPYGIFAIAQRTGSVIFPCFDRRTSGASHHLFFESPIRIPKTGDEEGNLVGAIRDYYRLLESWIEKYPDQWFWIYKRWKYCSTKKVLVLRDANAGHTNQAEAVAKEFMELGKRLGPDFHLSNNSIEVQFKTKWHQKLFFVWSWFFLPFAQGRLKQLNWFLTPSCVAKLETEYADFIISAGSHLAPLNLLLKRENLAKSIVLMKPSFPFRSSLFDLMIVPHHDRMGRVGCNSVRTFLAPNRVNEDLLKNSGEMLRKRIAKPLSESKTLSVFIGGKSKGYRFDPKAFQEWLRQLKTQAKELQFDLLITTSRRTTVEASELVKREFASDPVCKLLVIANEANIENVTYGMLALSKAALVTEDSVSMVSEAVSAGKGVLVLKLGNGKLSQKHRRFHEILESNHLIQTADTQNFSPKLASLGGVDNAGFRQRESDRIQEGLRSLL